MNFRVGEDAVGATGGSQVQGGEVTALIGKDRPSHCSPTELGSRLLAWVTAGIGFAHPHLRSCICM